MKLECPECKKMVGAFPMRHTLAYFASIFASPEMVPPPLGRIMWHKTEAGVVCRGSMDSVEVPEDLRDEWERIITHNRKEREGVRW